MSDNWIQDQLPVADVLGREFESVRTPRSTFQYILSLKRALHYTEESEEADRVPLRRRIIDSLKRSESAASKSPEIAEQYREIRADYQAFF